MSRDLSKLTPRLRSFVENIIIKAKELLGIDVFVVETDRPFNTQVAYYAQGRETLDVTNRLRKRAGLGPIGEKENSRCITWTMASNHITNLANDDETDDLSRAVDLGIKDKMGKYDGSSKADTNKDNKPDYLQLGAIGKMIDPGIEWGGDWKGKKQDMPHWQEQRAINPA